MQRLNILQKFLFVIFFSTGAIALSISILCVELIGYWQDKQIIQAEQEYTKKLKSLNADYDALLKQLEKDPNLIERASPAILGTEPNDANTVYPKVTAEQLAADRKILGQDLNQQSAEPVVPKWLSRCQEPLRRIMLFLSGSLLILISFVCFSSSSYKIKQDL